MVIIHFCGSLSPPNAHLFPLNGCPCLGAAVSEAFSNVAPLLPSFQRTLGWMLYFGYPSKTGSGHFILSYFQHGHLQKYQTPCFRSVPGKWPFTPSWGHSTYITSPDPNSQGPTFNNCPIKNLWGSPCRFSINIPKNMKNLRTKINTSKRASGANQCWWHIRALFAHVAGLAHVPKASRLTAFYQAGDGPTNVPSLEDSRVRTVESLVCFVLSHSTIALDNCIQDSNHPITKVISPVELVANEGSWTPLSPHKSYQSVIHQTVGVDWVFLQKSEVIW